MSPCSSLFIAASFAHQFPRFGARTSPGDGFNITFPTSLATRETSADLLLVDNASGFTAAFFLVLGMDDQVANGELFILAFELYLYRGIAVVVAACGDY